MFASFTFLQFFLCYDPFDACLFFFLFSLFFWDFMWLTFWVIDQKFYYRLFRRLVFRSRFFSVVVSISLPHAAQWAVQTQARHQPCHHQCVNMTARERPWSTRSHIDCRRWSFREESRFTNSSLFVDHTWMRCQFWVDAKFWLDAELTRCLRVLLADGWRRWWRCWGEVWWLKHFAVVIAVRPATHRWVKRFDKEHDGREESGKRKYLTRLPTGRFCRAQ